HREAFSFDKANPNSGYRYTDPPRRLVAGKPEGLKSGAAGGTGSSSPAVTRDATHRGSREKAAR
ncbi:MAG: hypothetical protein ACYC61_13775, partial [Isosphaeraceae bacterium]